jgi:hypothetical protein
MINASTQSMKDDQRKSMTDILNGTTNKLEKAADDIKS